MHDCKAQLAKHTIAAWSMRVGAAVAGPNGVQGPQGALHSPLATRSDYSSQFNRLEPVRRLNPWSGGKNLPGILFSDKGKIFRRQYWNAEYSRNECCGACCVDCNLAKGGKTKSAAVCEPPLHERRGRAVAVLVAALGDIDAGARI